MQHGFWKESAAASGRSTSSPMPADMAGYLAESRGLYQGAALAVVRPARHRGGRLAVARLRRGRRRHRAAGRQHRARRRPACRTAAIVLSLARLDRIREIDPVNATMTVEAGCILQSLRSAAADAADLLFPLSLAVRGLVPDRRQPRDQRRRRRGAALRQHPRPRARPRGRARRRAGLERAERPAQGQHGLRPEEAVRRLGGHARHHHGGGPEALPAARRRRRRPSSAAPRRSARSTCSSACAKATATRSPPSS